MQEAAARAVPWGAASSWPPVPRTWRPSCRPAARRERQWFTRVTADPDYLRRALELGLPRAQLCAMQGPFSQAFNEALWRDWGIDCVVTKDSGEAGGYRAKVEAARALGIPLLTVRRPRLDYPQVTHDFAEVHAGLAALAEPDDERRIGSSIGQRHAAHPGDRGHRLPRGRQDHVAARPGAASPVAPAGAC
jgi:precorrin-3B C17-methyltransferase